MNELVEPGYRPHYYDLDIDGSNDVLIAYLSDKNYSTHTYLLRRSAGTWANNELPYNMGTARQLDMAIDSSNAVHLVHRYDEGSGGILYRENTTTDWSNFEELPSGAAGWDPCLDTGSNQDPHITWSHISTNIMYSCLSNGLWQTETIAEGRLSSIRLDAQGVPHVLIQRSVGDTSYLFYAKRSAVEGWRESQISTVSGRISKTGLALDGQGNPHVAFINSTDGGLSNRIYYASGFEDPDGDGMPTYWEVQYGLNPADYHDATQDADADGLSNLFEYQRGLNPTNPDTDQDGLTDAQEVLPELSIGSESFEPAPVATPVAMRALADAPAGGGGLPAGWSTGGDAQWSMVSDEACDGIGSIRSGAIVDSQTSYVKLTTNLNAGRISFWIKCSSESASDFLAFQIDGVTSNTWSGEISWTNASVSFAAGPHTFRWIYSKDGSGSSGFDAAWLDLVEFYENGIGTDPLNSDTDGDTMGDGWEVSAGLDPKASADGTVDADGDGSSNEHEFVADTDPNDSNDWFHVTAMDATSSQVLYFDSSADRVYSLLSCTNLIDGGWTTNAGGSPRMGVGGPDSIEVTNSLSKGFYKLTVELP